MKRINVPFLRKLFFNFILQKTHIFALFCHCTLDEDCRVLEIMYLRFVTINGLNKQIFNKEVFNFDFTHDMKDVI